MFSNVSNSWRIHSKWTSKIRNACNNYSCDVIPIQYSKVSVFCRYCVVSFRHYAQMAEKDATSSAEIHGNENTKNEESYPQRAKEKKTHHKKLINFKNFGFCIHNEKWMKSWSYNDQTMLWTVWTFHWIVIMLSYEVKRLHLTFDFRCNNIFFVHAIDLNQYWKFVFCL